MNEEEFVTLCCLLELNLFIANLNVFCLCWPLETAMIQLSIKYIDCVLQIPVNLTVLNLCIAFSSCSLTAYTLLNHHQNYNIHRPFLPYLLRLSFQIPRL